MKKLTLYDMVCVGVMVAIIFILTYFIKIPIPTPAGQVMFKLANGFCLLAGVLFGGVRGGIASGLGSMLYDLLDPIYITSAPTTFIRFFLMAFICGVICSRVKGAPSFRRILVATSAGSAFSLVYYFIESLLKKTLETTGFTSMIFTQTGLEAFQAAFVACVPKLITSGINAVLGVTVACLLAPAMRTALQKVGFYTKSSLAR